MPNRFGVIIGNAKCGDVIVFSYAAMFVEQEA